MTASKSPASYVRRYTDIPAILYMLRNKKLTLLDPKSWDDSNDSYYLAEYKRRKNLESVLALCLTKAPETYHHWRVFSNGTAGVCIRFKQSSLIKAVTNAGVAYGDVEYLMLNDAKKKAPTLEELPYIKRAAYVDEAEFRLIFQSKEKGFSTFDIDLPIAAINRITLSPWLHKSLVAPIKMAINGIPGCENIDVVRSTLIGNEKWKQIGAKAT